MNIAQPLLFKQHGQIQWPRTRHRQHLVPFRIGAPLFIGSPLVIHLVA